MPAMSQQAAELLAHASIALAKFHYHEALNAAQIALAELESDPDMKLQAMAHELCGQAALNCGEYLQSEEHFRNAANLLDELNESRRMMACQCWLAECANRQGDLRGARHQALEALEIVQDAGWLDLEARARNCLGNICWQEGKLDEAEVFLKRAVELFSEHGSAHQASSARSSLGIVYALQGKEAEAAQLLTTALRDFQEAGDLARMVRCLNNMAGLAFQRGDPSRAREYLLQCVDMEQDMQDRGDLVQSWYNLGVIEMHSQELALARKYFHRAKHLAQEVGDRATEGAALLQLGIASLLDNDPDAAMNFLVLGETLMAGSPSTTAQVVQNYKPVFFLAQGHFELARKHWASRPASIEPSLLNALHDLLHFLQSSRFTCAVQHDEQFQSILRDWIEKMDQAV
jgi:tetratricopeptide (TPR) repeat protein